MNREKTDFLTCGYAHIYVTPDPGNGKLPGILVNSRDLIKLFLKLFMGNAQFTGIRVQMPRNSPIVVRPIRPIPGTAHSWESANNPGNGSTGRQA